MARAFNAGPYPEKNFDIRAGDTILYNFQLRISGSDTNTSSCTTRFSVVKQSNNSTVITNQAVNKNVVASGQMTMEITSTQTSNLSGAYRHEIENIWPSGHADVEEGAVKTVAVGSITVAVGIVGS